MRLLVLGMVLALGGCGGGTTGTNYSDAPPMAEIVATPSPKASPTPEEADAAAKTDEDASNATENLAAE